MSLQSVSNIFVASLALAALFVRILLQPLLVFINITAHHIFTPAFGVLFQIRIFLSYLITALSLGTLTFLSLERSIALHWHLRYYESVTTKKVTITLTDSTLGVSVLDEYYHLVCMPLAAIPF